MVAGLVPMALWRPPDILVDAHGAAFAARAADGALMLSSGGRLLRDIWGRRAGPLAPGRWPRWGQSADGRLTCDPDWCLYDVAGRRVAFVRRGAGVGPACVKAALVVSKVPIRRGACPGAARVIDRYALWRKGARAIWLEPGGGVRVASVSAWQGDRPWSFDPWRNWTAREGRAAGIRRRTATGSAHPWKSRVSARR
jgi:competence protein ComEC